MNSTQGTGRWVQWAGGIAAAIVVGLYLWTRLVYGVKDFYVPTRSMAPTIPPGSHASACMSAYRMRGPARWDIVVYRYPADPAHVYIHRLVGLPGEAVRILGGDVYINGEIARKPWSVQQALWRRRGEGPDLPPERLLDERQSQWLQTLRERNAEPWVPQDPSRWRLGQDEFTLDGQQSPDFQCMDYLREILAYQPSDLPLSSSRLACQPTSDTLVQFRLVPRAAAGEADVLIRVETDSSPPAVIDRWRIRFPIADGECYASLFRNDAPVTGDTAERPFRLRVNEPTLVQVAHVDESVLVRVGDAQVLCAEYEPGRMAYLWPGSRTRARVQIGGRGAHVTFRQPALFADIYYTESPDRAAVRQPFQLGNGEFFVLGDNSANANDSRDWGALPRQYLLGEVTGNMASLGERMLVRFLRHSVPWLAVYILLGTLLKDVFIRRVFPHPAEVERRLFPVAASTALAGVLLVNPWVIPEVMALLGCPPLQMNAQGLPVLEPLHVVVFLVLAAAPCVLDQFVWRVAGRLDSLRGLRWTPRVVPSLLGGLIASVVAWVGAACAAKALDLV